MFLMYLVGLEAFPDLGEVIIDALCVPAAHSPLITRAICSRMPTELAVWSLCGRLTGTGSLVSLIGPWLSWLQALTSAEATGCLLRGLGHAVSGCGILGSWASAGSMGQPN